MNEALIKIFSDMADYETFEKRVFPAKAYRNFISTLKELDFEVDDVEQIKGFYGVGSGIIGKVDSYLKTGTFPRYEEYLNSDCKKCKEISEIKGFGMNKAKKLFEAGIKSVEDLKEKTKDLNVGDVIPGTDMKLVKAMKVGLDFEAHTDKNRMTVEQHDSVANPIIEELKNDPRNKQVDAVGSRRRFDGSADYTIGDIDIIIAVDPNDNTEEYRKTLEDLLDEVVMSGSTKISGIKNRRQIDFRMVTPDKYGSLLLHSTGPMKFNVACRKIAISKGQVLNEYGLWNKEGMKLIESQDEKKILDLLGIGWVKPEDRKNFG